MRHHFHLSATHDPTTGGHQNKSHRACDHHHSTYRISLPESPTEPSVFGLNWHSQLQSNVGNDELSHIYGQFDHSQIARASKGKAQLSMPIDGEVRYLGSPSLDQKIMELRQQGYGIERIAKSLGCSTWTVRKCLSQYE